MRKLFGSGLLALAAAALSACAGHYTSKDFYSVYLAQPNSQFSASNGTLSRGGQLDVTYKGERFTGQNANNKITAKGSKGNSLTCSYTMPGSVATGTCQLSGGTALNMKFD
ncbi:hypothetical protein ACIF8Z_17070 [Pseudomonas promysalinigenes]|uniref:Lipoprotein n=1 Tax=Pseudomonas promysalinigenes TaxID=485898 RepID=A0ABY6AMC6_9PSED|nr:hypothetical protein [Pseudomonas promysalinigenes]UXH39963.1 hypothetical protein N5C08_23980 [Pseudomonas promysalinigenes]